MIIGYSKKFKKAYKKLDVSVRVKVKQRIELFSQDLFHPLLHDHSVDPPFDGARSINITGDYRALYTKEKGGIILFIAIGTHSQLYK